MIYQHLQGLTLHRILDLTNHFSSPRVMLPICDENGCEFAGIFHIIATIPAGMARRPFPTRGCGFMQKPSIHIVGADTIRPKNVAYSLVVST